MSALIFYPEMDWSEMANQIVITFIITLPSLRPPSGRLVMAFTRSTQRLFGNVLLGEGDIGSRYGPRQGLNLDWGSRVLVCLLTMRLWLVGALCPFAGARKSFLTFADGIACLQSWSHRPDAAMWFAISWARGGARPRFVGERRTGFLDT